MVSRVKLAISGFDAIIQTPKIVLFYDQTVYDESKISIPISDLDSVDSYTAKDGMLTINLKPITGGLEITIPIGWKFKKYVTPEYTPFPIDAFFLNDGGHPLAQANPIDFQGYYPNPYINKYANGSNHDGIVLRNFTPSRYGDPAIDDVESEYVDFTFSVKNLERNVGMFTITDTLPVYPSMENGVESERTAIFDPADNPDWELSVDGTTITYTGNAYNSRNIKIPRLRLRFPWAMYYYNIQNSVSGVLTPFNKSIFEDDMLVSDSLVFSFGELPSSIGIFDKKIYRPHYGGGKAYFYDNDFDRHLDMPWELWVNATSEMYNIVLSDFNLDQRLYYSSAIVPEAFVGGTYHLIDEAGISFVTGEITSTELSWSQDDGLLTKRVEFHVPYLPVDFYITTLNTRLVNPDIPHFDPAEGSPNNVFFNSGSLSYSSAPDTDPLYVEDTEPLYVVNVNMKVQPSKTQMVKNDPSVTLAAPSDPVKYNIYVNDRSEGSHHDPLNAFVMIDLMPNGVLVNSVELSSEFLECDGTYQIIQDYNNTGRVGIVFNSPSLVNHGTNSTHIATINAVVDPYAQDGMQCLNEVFMDFNNDKVENIGEQVWNQLNDPEHTYSRATTQFAVWAISEVRAFKAIRNSATEPWNYTGIETPSGGQFEYSLNILNYTENPKTNVVLVDVFPYIDDTAITENLDGVRLPRGSQFTNTFDTSRSVSVNLPGYTVKYYNSDTPIDYGSGSTEDVLDNLTWSNTPAANTIAIRIEQDANVELAANAKLIVIIPMIAPANNDLSLSGLKAYNTFVRKDDSTAFGGVNRYLEPNRVYNMIPIPEIDITLTKVGEDPGIFLQGAVFELRDSEGNLVMRSTTDINGVITFSNIKIGDYTLTEVQAPTGYKLLPNPITITQQEMIDAFNAGIALAIGPIPNSPQDPPPIIGSVTYKGITSECSPASFRHQRSTGCNKYATS